MDLNDVTLKNAEVCRWVVSGEKVDPLLVVAFLFLLSEMGATSTASTS